MLTRLDKAPFPYSGGKADAAPLIWEALGDVDHYAEPFGGSLVTLLRRPHEANRTYHSETVNDADGLLVNAFRAIQHSPEATADACSWPVTEADVMARQLWLLRWKAERDVERLMADPDYHDPRAAGYWLYGLCAWIGSGWCAGTGPWIVGADGRIVRRSGGAGVHRKRPHLSNDGMGVQRPQAREPGVARQLPHLSDDGRGVQRPQAREPGVARQLPHLSDNGRGVQRPQAREPGVADGAMDFHPMTMPELRRWFAFLSARLRHVRILNGDWRRLSTQGALKTLTVRQGKGKAGIFLDPPYGAAAGRTADLYNHDDPEVAAHVRAWCLANGADPDYRIVLAGFAGEGHEELERHGWRAVEWYARGHLRGGYANQGESGTQQHRERLWLSPHCLQAERAPETPPLWALLDAVDVTPTE